MKARIQKFIILSGICLPSVSLHAVVGVSILYLLITDSIPQPEMSYENSLQLILPCKVSLGNAYGTKQRLYRIQFGQNGYL